MNVSTPVQYQNSQKLSKFLEPLFPDFCIFLHLGCSKTILNEIFRINPYYFLPLTHTDEFVGKKKQNQNDHNFGFWATR